MYNKQREQRNYSVAVEQNWNSKWILQTKRTEVHKIKVTKSKN